MFPSNGSLKRRPLPSAGSIGPVPPPHRYYEALRPPAIHLAALRCLRLAIPPWRPVCSQRPGRRPWAPGSWYSGSRAGNVGRDGRVSQVPGQPLCPYALLSDPGRIEDARPLRRLDVAPAFRTTKAPDEKSGFGAQSHGLGTGCLRFVLAVTRHDARLASGCLAKPGRAGVCYPQGCDERFLSSSLVLPSQAFLALWHHLFPCGCGPWRMVRDTRRLLEQFEAVPTLAFNDNRDGGELLTHEDRSTVLLRDARHGKAGSGVSCRCC